MTPTHSYLATHTCGCFAGVALDDDRLNLETLATWRALGLRVERVTNEVARKHITIWCGHRVRRPVTLREVA